MSFKRTREKQTKKTNFKLEFRRKATEWFSNNYLLRLNGGTNLGEKGEIVLSTNSTNRLPLKRDMCEHDRLSISIWIPGGPLGK